MIEQRAMHVKDFLAAYGLSRTTCYRLLNTGRLKSVQIGRRRLILRDSAEALLNGVPSSFPTQKQRLVANNRTQ